MASLQALKRVEDTLSWLKETQSFDYLTIEKMRVVDASDDHCVCEMAVEQQHLNPFGSLHGGCLATMVDAVSSVALYAPPPHVSGVSIDLSITFLRGVNLGEDILIEAKNQKIGKRLAFLEVAIRRKRDGQLIATGKHTKYLSQSNSEPKL